MANFVVALHPLENPIPAMVIGGLSAVATNCLRSYWNDQPCVLQDLKVIAAAGAIIGVSAAQWWAYHRRG